MAPEMQILEKLPMILIQKLDDTVKMESMIHKDISGGLYIQILERGF